MLTCGLNSLRAGMSPAELLRPTASMTALCIRAPEQVEGVRRMGLQEDRLRVDCQVAEADRCRVNLPQLLGERLSEAAQLGAADLVGESDPLHGDMQPFRRDQVET